MPVLVFAAWLAAGAMNAAAPSESLPPLPTVPQLLHLCAAATVAEVAEKGDQLGWPRMDEARMASWRAGYERGNGPVDVVGWFRGPQEADGLLSAWGASVSGRLQVCSYSVGTASGLLDGLMQALGPPSRKEESGPLISAEWNRHTGVVSFVQVGPGALVTVTPAP